MGISIKNPETERLARKLAELTGESMTMAVTEALREKVLRLQRENSRENRIRRMTELAKQIGDRLIEPYKSADHGDILYDEMGLPK